MLYREHALVLIRMAHIMLGNRAAAEDVVQDAFCGLYRHWDDLASKDRAIGYVRSSVLNGCRTVLRRIPARELTPDRHPISWSAEAVVLSAEERREVVRALRLLPERQRNVLVAASLATASRQARPSRPPGTTIRPASAAAMRGVPAYYIGLTTRAHRAGRAQAHRAIAGIYATGSGALLASVVPPGLADSVVMVTAAADDRAFAIATQVHPDSSRRSSVQFYLVSFNPASGRTRLTGIARGVVPQVAALEAVTLSPDGTELAVAYGPNEDPGNLTDVLKVVNLRTGAVRTWSSDNGNVATESADPWALNWVSARTLAVNWAMVPQPPVFLGPGSGLRLLTVTGRSGDVVVGSRLALPVHAPASKRATTAATTAGYLTSNPLLTGDGGTIVAAVSAFSGGVGGFAEFSASTGRLERRLDWRRLSGPADVLWASQDGQVLVVYAPPGYPGQIGIWRSGHLIALPRSPRISFPAAAW
ncbi:MAG TPA: sigma-70 family RNA polymerase sigma factor [Streptosporangiaceae bacterium]|nr:sigma-70 family RNA polymerase sigma factor [Streptosporangiaceae bacterium]